MKNEALFKNVYGYQAIKDELNIIREWLGNDEIISNPKLDIPLGILFEGEPGNGKTLLLREFANSFDCPKYIVSGQSSSITNELSDAFDNAAKDKFAIILIDEFDLLIESKTTQRLLQTKMDGIESRGRVLVIATTNHLWNIEDTLLRQGRFSRIINVGNPTKETREIMYHKYLEDLGVNTKKINAKHLANISSSSVSGADIKAVCNDAYLRKGANVKTEDIEMSYDRIVRKEYSLTYAKPHSFYHSALHEAGHILLTVCSPYYQFYRACVYSDSNAVTATYELDENENNFQKTMSYFRIGLGGYCSEKIFLKNNCLGSNSDLDKIFKSARCLVEKYGASGTKYFVQSYRNNDNRYDSMKHKDKINQKMVKIINKNERIVTKFLKTHKKALLNIANLLDNKSSISFEDVSNSLINEGLARLEGETLILC